MTTKSEHTPTPWAVDEDHPTSVVFEADTEIEICTTDSGSSAEQGEDEANAALIVRAVNSHAALVEALGDLVEIIDRAGLLNLSNGVQLGQTSWYVKASDRLEYARTALSLAMGEKQ
jgi:hypothetical protein